jgi:phosphoribosyl-ATP pyrophosphohydrolase/phosphoribosyl-AMP cyclohydrolase
VDDDGKLVAETADLLYHLVLLVKSRGLSLARVVRELESRHANRA